MQSLSFFPLSFAARRELIERVAPRYRDASLAQKGVMLDQVIAVTGYSRKYAIRLLNHLCEGKHTITRQRLPRYGAEVRQTLFLAWKAVNYVCVKRFIPFLPTLLPILERHGYLHVTEEHRKQVLQISTSTAERLLSPQRALAPKPLTLTQRGSLLKQQIPVRTFAQWDDTRPGFLEADLVGHHGGSSEGCFLFTLTLTDVATGWTECFPVSYKSPEAILVAFQQARRLFPFPILGLDTDNGNEFVNEGVVQYCEQEHLTFTRGRPDVKNDQCFVEQKNGAIVRHFVGHGRLLGSHNAQQLRELYRALRLYVNCFQPSIKLVRKQEEEGRVRPLYDSAKTPLERLLHSGILSETTSQHLEHVAQTLDPIRLLTQVEHLQHAVWQGIPAPFAPISPPSSASLVSFCLEQCFSTGSDGGTVTPSMCSCQSDESSPEMELPDWSRTMRDPFEGDWNLILSLVLTHPQWSARSLLHELQRQFPDRYQLCHLSSLQTRLRKIRARMLEREAPAWPQEIIQAERSVLDASPYVQEVREPEGDAHPSHQALLPQAQTDTNADEYQAIMKEGMRRSQGFNMISEESFQNHEEESQQMKAGQGQQIHGVTMTIAGAMQAYLSEQKHAGRSQKTVEWHQTSLASLHQYLVKERHLRFMDHVTDRELHDWITLLHASPSCWGKTRTVNTISTYGRSARAFCSWAVRKGYLAHMPLIRGLLPKTEPHHVNVIESAMFEQLLLACHAQGGASMAGYRLSARDQAILWVFWETGMRASELCGMRFVDVDDEHKRLRVGRQGKERWCMLSATGWSYLQKYAEACHRGNVQSEPASVKDRPFFVSEIYEPLTGNALTLLFMRLRKRAGIQETGINPLQVRDTFAVRYLQTGGTIEDLGKQLGLKDLEALKRYEHAARRSSEPAIQAEMHEFRSKRATRPKRRRRKTGASATICSQPQSGTNECGTSMQGESVAEGKHDLEGEHARTT